MWFFAIVYAVEGIGQAGAGILGQPIVYYLKQVDGVGPGARSVRRSRL